MLDLTLHTGVTAMAENVFAVIRTRGPRWNHERPLEGQEDWRPHANGLLRTVRVHPWQLRLGSISHP